MVLQRLLQNEEEQLDSINLLRHMTLNVIGLLLPVAAITEGPMAVLGPLGLAVKSGELSLLGVMLLNVSAAFVVNWIQMTVTKMIGATVSCHLAPNSSAIVLDSFSGRLSGPYKQPDGHRPDLHPCLQRADRHNLESPYRVCRGAAALASAVSHVHLRRLDETKPSPALVLCSLCRCCRSLEYSRDQRRQSSPSFSLATR